MHCRVEYNNVTITQLPYFPTGIPLATDLPDGSVDETAWLATIGRHALAHGGAPDSIGSAITLVPLPWLALPSQPNTPNGPTHVRQDKPGFLLITCRYAAIGSPSWWLASQR